MLVETDKLVCKVEIAEMAGVTAGAVTNWINRHPNFPRPFLHIRLGDLWLREHVEDWLANRSATMAQRNANAIEYHEARLRQLRGGL